MQIQKCGLSRVLRNASMLLLSKNSFLVQLWGIKCTLHSWLPFSYLEPSRKNRIWIVRHEMWLCSVITFVNSVSSPLFQGSLLPVCGIGSNIVFQLARSFRHDSGSCQGSEASIALGDKNIHIVNPGLFLTHLEAGHLELFIDLKFYENPKANQLKTKGIIAAFVGSCL